MFFRERKLILKLVILCLLASAYFLYEWNRTKVITVFRPMVRKAEYTLVTYKIENYNVLETENFIIRYDETDASLLRLISKTAEDKYEKLSEIFQYEVKEKILLIVYNDPDIFMDTVMLKRGTPPMGAYFGNSIHILNPYFWVGNKKDMEKIFYYEGPVLHELAHLFTDHIGKGNFPSWFTEGVSLYFEYEIDNYEWGKEVVFQEEDYTLEMLTNNFHELDEYKAYTKSFRIIKKFVEKRGVHSLIKIIEDLGKGKNLRDFYYMFEK